MAAASVLSCSICMDDDEAIVFECNTLDCGYQMCEPCLRELLDDPTVANSRTCPMCKESTGKRMVEAIAGQGAVRLVEHELRVAVEYDVKNDYLKKNQDKKDLDSLSTQARKIFHELSEDLNMKCPRCKIAFYDYDGCNALRCSQVGCNAAFCALCLKDCGSDAHTHVRKEHGNLFDKAAFEQSRVTREKEIIQRCMDELNDERFELRQMVQNQIERAKLGQTASSERTHLLTTFVAESRAALKHACNMDRLSILRDPQSRDCFRAGLSRDDISPRLVIPDEYRVELVPSDSSVYTIRVTEETEYGTRKHVSLEDLSQLTPAVDVLTNIKQAIQCGVIAFRGSRSLYQSKVVRPPKGVTLDDEDVSIRLSAVNDKGEASDDEAGNVFNSEVIGINQNLRMIKLSTYVEEKSADELDFEPLRHLVGVCKPEPILKELSCSPPPTIYDLNPEQQSVAHPLCSKSAMEVAGPPGSGKSKTITELVRGLLECTTKHIVVMSERNGAIDAIAEKFVDACVDGNGRNLHITDLDLWNKIMTFGAAATVGPSTELFTLEAKLRYHPELLQLRKQHREAKNIQSDLARKMRNEIVVALSESMRPFLAPSASTISRGLGQSLQQPCQTISYLLGAETDIKKVLQKANLRQDDVTALVSQNEVLLESLDLSRFPRELAKKKWDKDEAVAKLKRVMGAFSKLLRTPTFDEENARSIQTKIRQLEEQRRLTEERLAVELPRMARLQMSTIGSSHKLLSSKIEDVHENDDDLLADFENLSLADSESSTAEKAFVIFDEAGCIPSYELLGLTRLEWTIEALIVVGDKEQLPPYQSSASFSSSRQRTRDGKYGNARKRDKNSYRATSPAVKSLLDCSRLSLDSGEKVKLTTQYRVPKDIADLLNDRVYKGDYKTSPTSNVPSRGLRFIGVQADPNPRKKYVNKFEVDQVLEIILRHEGESVMVLTPYKNQQREIQFQLKRLELDGHKVLTIDQCQGQEADTVILSLVQRPTMFLNKNRLNVALSRVRQRLYLLTDKREFRMAARNSEWDCHLMAKDLLELWDEYE